MNIDIWQSPVNGHFWVRRDNKRIGPPIGSMAEAEAVANWLRGGGALDLVEAGMAS
jgi:hypothetical protein